MSGVSNGGTAFLSDPDVTLHHGDAAAVLRTFPDRSVHMCATSPPFYGLRDYGVEGQIGREESVDEWVGRLVGVFREVRRVLRDDGTLWVEIGDSFAGKPSGAQGQTGQRAGRAFTAEGAGGTPSGYKPKDLLGQPWLLAFALRSDGWYLRSEIIWHRNNPMPESVTDRPTKAHSTVFLLSKSARYFYDADAIREPYSENTHSRGRGIGVKQELEQTSGTKHAGRNNADFGNAIQRSQVDLARLRPQDETLDGLPAEAPRGRWPNAAGANARSVWTISTEPTPFAHFATWPQALCRKMIAAGCPTDGIVLDPFAGSGTTLLVARKLGRRAIGIELNADYCELASERLAQQSLLAEIA